MGGLGGSRQARLAATTSQLQKEASDARASRAIKPIEANCRKPWNEAVGPPIPPSGLHDHIAQNRSQLRKILRTTASTTPLERL
jgi:hypothetical protein